MHIASGRPLMIKKKTLKSSNVKQIFQYVFFHFIKHREFFFSFIINISKIEIGYRKAPYLRLIFLIN